MTKNATSKKKSVSKKESSTPRSKALPKAKAATSEGAAKPKSMMLVYGYDDERRARAAVFHEPDFKLARKAASLMDFRVFVGKPEKLQPALKGIRAGRVHASGTDFVGEVGLDRLEELIDVLRLPKPSLPAPEANLPTTWDGIEVGHMVIAEADDPALGWWPAVVEGLEGDILSLRAKDFPEVTASRHRAAVALIYTPQYVAPPDLSDAAPGLPKDWASLAAGHLVVARLTASEGWWQALVTKVEGRRVVLRWKDDPKLPQFTRTIPEVALLYPKPPQAPV